MSSSDAPQVDALDKPGGMRRRKRLWIGAAVAAVVVALGLYWFQPWQALIDKTADDPLPGGTAAEVDTMASGAFVSFDHTTTGTAMIIETEDGSRFLRFEDLDTSNGPDLRVYLSAAEATTDDAGEFDDDYLDLGGLKGNVGDQNYAIPADADLDRYRSAVVWCRRFSVAFGAAPL